MSFVLLAVGILLAIAGFLTLGFGIPNKEFSLGSTLIVSGTVSLCAGFLLVGVAFAVRELRRIARLLEGRGFEAGPVRANARPLELNEARVPLAPRAAQETFAHEYAPREPAHAAPPMERDASPDHPVAGAPPHELPPWASETRRPSAPLAHHPASHPARPGAPPQPAPHSDRLDEDREAGRHAVRDAASGHRAGALQSAPEPFELTPPEPEPASPPKPSLAARFGFPSRRETNDAPVERKRMMLERNGRRIEPGGPAHDDEDAEDTHAAGLRAPRPRSAAPHIPEEHLPRHEQTGDIRQPDAPRTPDAAHADAHSENDGRPSDTRATPPRGPDFETLWPAPSRPRGERLFGKLRGARAEEPRLEERRADEPHVDAPHVDAPHAEKFHAESGADDSAAPVQPDLETPAHVVSVLKSGVVDGMAYSLYSDGSIEAHLPGGPVRFASIDALRDHLDKGG